MTINYLIKTTLRLINNRVSWIITIIFLGVWLGVDITLAHWGENQLPIQRIVHSYKLPSDILFMGNSRVTTGIKPSMITELSTKSTGYPIQSYNLGIPSTPFGIHYLLLKHEIQQGKQPKLLIYGFVDNELTATGFFDDANVAQLSKDEDLPLLFKKSFVTIDSRSDLLLKKISRVYRYRFLIREVLNRYLAHSQLKPVQLNNNVDGFLDLDNVVRSEAINQLINLEKSPYYKGLYDTPINWSFEPSKTYLEDFVKLALQSKIKLIFVELPTTQLHNQMAQKSVYRKAYLKELKLYFKNYGISLYSLRDVEPDDHIPDTVHLSNTGATSFTQILFDKVIREHLFEVRAARRQSY
ncbi:MAG: DUF1574 family protein [Nostoc sp.]|uniref:DUF1574 family protein n=1 Tax=Nostoc sp. TaxID=1180 RepID=UPI002FFCFFF7